MPIYTSPQAVLKQVFGYPDFKPLQLEAINNILARRDTLVIFPTGGGKSLCYQIPALLFAGLTVVVSPLIALMKDQVDQLRQLNVPAVFLNSSLGVEEFHENTKLVRSGKVKLLYLAPEALVTERMLALLASVPLDCIAIDEAHCISEWGHDFRPEYRQIIDVRNRFPSVVCVAMTATATPRVRKDIQDTLNFGIGNEFISSFNRENLLIEVKQKKEPFEQVMNMIQRYPGQPGIIYCFSRKQVDDLTADLSRRKIIARPYHAGLSDDERKANQDAFLRDDIQVIVATIAFGMGINKSNVRFIVHYDLPKSIEGYYQEIGRAGRDGLPAHCVLLYGYGDVQKQRYFIEQKEAGERRIAYQQLASLTRYAESAGCRRKPILAYFGETYPDENCGMCDHCRKGINDLVDMTVPAQKFISCVLRSGQRFGPAYITDILLGETTEKVKKNGHDSISTFGIGSELDRDNWMRLGRQLVALGALAQEEEYGTLRVTPSGQEKLRTRESIFLEPPEMNESSKTHTRSQIEHDKVLYELLRKKRKELADQNGIPPYVIFSDRSLVEMAAYFPQTRSSFLTINGVGEAKLERFGDIFLHVIRDYCMKRGLDERNNPSTGEKKKEPGSKARTPRKKEVAEAFNSGKTIRDLADQYGIKIDTVLDHLYAYALEGNRLRNGNDVVEMANLTLSAYESAVNAFQVEGLQLLKPVYDRLSGLLTYDQLKLVRLHYLMNITT